MSQVHSVGSVAELLGVNPRRITHLFYEKILPSHEAPVRGGNRLIPARLIRVIAEVLESRGVRVNREALDRLQEPSRPARKRKPAGPCAAMVRPPVLPS